MRNRKLRLHRILTGRWGSDNGQALIETALTLPMLFLLLLGAAEFARLAYESIELTNAAKAAAQYGAQNGNAAGDVAGMQFMAQQDAPDLSLPLAATTVDNTQCECIVSGVPGAPSAGACTAACAGGYSAQILSITTQMQYTPVIHAWGFARQFTLQGHAVQEVLK